MNQVAAIAPDPENSAYWRFDGRTRVLLGGSVEDNLFQIDGLESHLDTLVDCGGNYVRCTMSSRDPGNVWPFHRDPDTGRYDLERMGAEYWDRFDRFLELTAARRIVIQIELWDRFDFSRRLGIDGAWDANPFNPACNQTYTAEASGLAADYPKHPANHQHPFFRTVPGLDDNRVVLAFQQRFVDRLLASTLRFGHVLYCMDNETKEDPAWGAYWASYIQAKAKKAGTTAMTTEMWDAWDIRDPMHDATFLDPRTYPFIDCSQNNQCRGAEHWEHLQARRRQLREAGMTRPMNTVKTYGADGGRHGSTADAVARFWRSLLGGCASARFHRPPSGLGLTELAQHNLRATRVVSDAIDLPACDPDGSPIGQTDADHAWGTAHPDGRCCVFLLEGARPKLSRRYAHAEWVSPNSTVRHSRDAPPAGEPVKPPGGGPWVVLLTP